MFENQKWKECNVQDAQKVMLSTLDEVDRICKKYSIPYWLEAGSLLGCVRHSGFIPWDDDLDIGMLKSDFEKFSNVVQKELPPHLVFQTKNTDPKYHKKIPKIRNIYSKIVEDDETETEQYCQGIFVDIFVFDYISTTELLIRKNLVKLLKLKAKKSLFPKGSIKRALFNLCLVPIQISYTLLKVLLQRLHTGKRSPFIGTTPDFTIYGLNHRTEWVFPLKNALFEGREFPIFFNADAALTNHFGNWRQIPPKDKRVSHAKKIYISREK